MTRQVGRVAANDLDGHFEITFEGCRPRIIHRPSGEICLREAWMTGPKSATWAFKLRAFRLRFPGTAAIVGADGVPHGSIDDLPSLGGSIAIGDFLCCHDTPAGASYARRVAEKIPMTGGLPGEESDVLLLEDGSIAVFDRMSCRWQAASALSDQAGLWSHRISASQMTPDLHLETDAVVRSSFHLAEKQIEAIRDLPWHRDPLRGSSLHREAVEVMERLRHPEIHVDMADTVRRAGAVATTLIERGHHRPRGHLLYDPLDTLRRVARCLDGAMALRQENRPDIPNTDGFAPCR